MSEQVRVSTPENVEFYYEVADLGSRFIAACVDTVLLSLLLFLLSCLTYAFLPFVLFEVQEAAAWVIAGLALVSLSLTLGYFIYFEVTWNGQSPGKRIAGLRVIGEDGYPVTFLRSVIRNFVRTIDFLPSLYAVGVIAMFCNARARRLGDFAAGTIVVKERRDVSLRQLLSWDLEQERGAERPLPNLERLDGRRREMGERFMARRDELSDDAYLELSDRIARALARDIGHDLGGETPLSFLRRVLHHNDQVPDQQRLLNLHRLSGADRGAVRAFLQRRQELSPESRRRLAQELASRVAARIDYLEPVEDAEAFLAQALRQARW